MPQSVSFSVTLALNISHENIFQNIKFTGARALSLGCRKLSLQEPGSPNPRSQCPKSQGHGSLDPGLQLSFICTLFIIDNNNKIHNKKEITQ